MWLANPKGFGVFVGFGAMLDLYQLVKGAEKAVNTEKRQKRRKGALRQ